MCGGGVSSPCIAGAATGKKKGRPDKFQGQCRLLRRAPPRTTEVGGANTEPPAAGMAGKQGPAAEDDAARWFVRLPAGLSRKRAPKQKNKNTSKEKGARHATDTPRLCRLVFFFFILLTCMAATHTRAFVSHRRGASASRARPSAEPAGSDGSRSPASPTAASRARQSCAARRVASASRAACACDEGRTGQAPAAGRCEAGADAEPEGGRGKAGGGGGGGGASCSAAEGLRDEEGRGGVEVEAAAVVVVGAAFFLVARVNFGWIRGKGGEG